MPRFYTNFASNNGTLLMREVDGSSRTSYRKRPSPSAFVLDPMGEYKTHTGEPVSKRVFDGVGAWRAFREKYEGVDEFPVYGSDAWDYAAVSEMYPGAIDFDRSMISVAFFDLEVKSDDGFPEPEAADKEITAIAMSLNGRMNTFSFVPYDPPPDVAHHACDSEAELLVKFLEFWNAEMPDVLVGWNSEFFDVPYLVNRITRVLGQEYAEMLSPWKILRRRATFHNGRDRETIKIVGVSHVDYLQAYEKFTHTPRESYALDFIASAELGEKKLDYSEYASLSELYERNPQLFMEYNVKDVHLIERLDARLGLLDLIFTIAYYAKVNFEDTFGTVKVWETMIHNYLMDRKVVVPRRRSAVKLPFEGGHVKEVQVGKHEWVASYDFDSLYPHLIMALNISPEKIRGSLPGSRLSVDAMLAGALDAHDDFRKRYAIAGSCHLYERDSQGFFPALMENLYSERSANKKKASDLKKRLKAADLDPAERDSLESQMKRYHNLQLAMKYALNSGYGAMSNQYFLWFDMRMAESVTLSGQLAVRYVADKMNEYLDRIAGTSRDRIIAIDTDSIYVALHDVVKRFMGDSPGDATEFAVAAADGKFAEVIAAACASWAEYVGAFPGKLKMKREKVAKAAVWTAMKKYALLVVDDEGVRLPEPEMKFTGLEVIKTTTPAKCREAMTDAIKTVLVGTEAELQREVAAFREVFDALPPSEMGIASRVNGVVKYVDGNGGYKSGVPQHVRAAINYNYTIERLGLTNKHRSIGDGEKVKYVFLKTPNATGQEVVAFPVELPSEMGLDQQVDRNRQFERVYVQPLKIVLNAVGWEAVPTASMASFF